MNFGERITQLRKEFGYSTRNEFANKLGIPSTTLRNYETNVREPGHTFLKQLSELFNVSVDYLLCLTDDREVLNSFRLRIAEQDMIEKYRALDDYGRETVDIALERETRRTQSLKALSDQADQFQAELSRQRTVTRYFSYYGRVAAAGASFGFEDIVENATIMELPLTDLNRSADYLIGVNGDSMEPAYSDGDIVYVKKTDHLEIGQVGIFQKDNGIYIKEVGENGLISRNEKYKPMINGGDVICLGRVIGKIEEQDYSRRNDLEIQYSKQAEKFLKKRDAATRKRILNAIHQLPAGDVKKFQGYAGYRLRVGDYQVIFNKDGHILYIERIDNKGQIYKEI